MSGNLLRSVRLRFTQEILQVACRRFGFSHPPSDRLEGSAFVYEGRVGSQPCILKVTPGLLQGGERVLGATAAQVLGELDFVHYLAAAGVPVALPIPSLEGKWVETIPLDAASCFLAYAFEKVPGFMYPDDDVVSFPDEVIREWGGLLGRIHHLSAAYVPSNPAWRRLSWEEDDLLEYSSLVPANQPLVWQRFDQLIAFLRALPCTSREYGLLHGDLHHGNFFNDQGRLVAFDFDAAHYSWYVADISIALYNCLPMPRALTAERRGFSLHFLARFLEGYRRENELPSSWLGWFPLFLKWNEFLDYAHHLKYWDLENLSEKRRSILADLRRRIEQEIPVVEFEPGDLDGLSLAGTLL